jgi:hypothetical protein
MVVGGISPPEQPEQWSLRRALTVEELERFKHFCPRMGTLKGFLMNGVDLFNWPKLDVHEIVAGSVKSHRNQTRPARYPSLSPTARRVMDTPE